MKTETKRSVVHGWGNASRLCACSKLVPFALVIVCATLFAAGASATPALPDGRVFERVSPLDTLGAPAIQLAGGIAFPLDDNSFIYGGGPTPATEGKSGINATYVARRGALGWDTASLLPSEIGGSDDYILDDMTPDLSASVWAVESTFTISLNPPPGFLTPHLLRYRNAQGLFSTILDEPRVVVTPGVSYDGGYVYGGMSQDGQSVVFSSHQAPVGASNPSGLRRLWRWHPNGSVETLATEPGSPLADCNVEIVGGGSDAFRGTDVTTNGVSADGRTVFLHDGVTEGGPGPCPEASNPPESQVYVDRDDRVELVSEPEGGLEEHQAAAYFRGASPDGDTAWIETEAPLTAEDNYRQSGVSNLYRWEAPAGGKAAALTCLTCGPAGSVSESVFSQNELSTSGSYLYFVKRFEEEETLTTGLFVEHEGEVRQVPLSSEQASGVGFTANPSINATGNTAVLTIGGALYVVEVGPGGLQVSPLARSESGEAATGVAVGFFSQYLYNGALQTAGLAGRASGAISADGKTIVFESKEVLAPGGEDATAFRQQQQPFTNIYRWYEGEVAYLGRGAGTGTGVAVTADGHDIFFQSPDELVAGEPTPAAAIFDARIGGGFPTPSAAPAPCAAEAACRGSAASAPSTPAPKSTAPAEGSRPGTRSLSLVGPSATQLRGFARSGAISLKVRVEGGGRLKASAEAKVDGRGRTVAEGTRKVGSRSATVVVRLRLDAVARKALRETGRLRVRLRATLVGAGTKTKTVILKEGRGK